MTPWLFALLLSAPAGDRPELHAVRTREPIAVDGVLSEGIWSEAPAATDLVQTDPAEGAPATERTEVRLAYDDQALYVAARLYDREPGKIVARLGRRDSWLKADAFSIYLDSYHDRRSGFLFSVNAAGTLLDGTLSNDDWDDLSWDGVWEGRAHVDAEGWSVEMRIPFSQLRFRPDESLRFGVNARRYIGRKNEDDFLAIRPKAASGFVSRFPDLVGLDGIHPRPRLTVAPYTTVRAESGTDHPGVQAPTAGLDVKSGLAHGLNLDATFNPDFGQVEVDPAVVNLSDTETYYDEKRPFFVEGSSTFDFGQGGASDYWGFNFPNPQFFYSRRIGRVPHGVPEGEVVDSPLSTTILGAAKLTGKLGSWNLGVLQALTAREEASVVVNGAQARAEIEPPAWSSVVRLQRSWPDNRQGLGFIGTALHRSLTAGSPLADQVTSDAFALGLDGWRFLGHDKTWVLTGWLGGTSVHGSKDAITSLQQGAGHYFQRPDADYLPLDPEATSLSGGGGRLWLNKEKGNVVFNAALGVLTPGFDTNDLGFSWRSDVLNAHAGGGYRWTQPGRVFRSASLRGFLFQSHDLGGTPTWRGVFVQANSQFLNYWKLNSFVAFNPPSYSNNATRGGPLLSNPDGFEWDVRLQSNDQKPLWGSLGTHRWDYAKGSTHGGQVYGSVEWRPGTNLVVGLEPKLEWIDDGAGWVGSYADAAAVSTYGTRYVFAKLAQRTAVMGVRLNWTFTPRLSLQLYAQPLIASGRYTDFGELARPRSYEFTRYGSNPPVAFDDPSFDLRSLRGNAVLRWEFRPASTAYLVWTQNRADQGATGDFRLGQSLSQLASARAENILLIKIAYGWNR